MTRQNFVTDGTSSLALQICLWKGDKDKRRRGALKAEKIFARVSLASIIFCRRRVTPVYNSLLVKQFVFDISVQMRRANVFLRRILLRIIRRWSISSNVSKLMQLYCSRLS